MILELAARAWIINEFYVNKSLQVLVSIISYVFFDKNRPCWISNYDYQNQFTIIKVIAIERTDVTSTQNVIYIFQIDLWG